MCQGKIKIFFTEKEAKTARIIEFADNTAASGDASSLAALVTAYCAAKAKVRIENVPSNAPDTEFVEILRGCGYRFEEENGVLFFDGTASPSPFIKDFTDCPDLFPSCCAVAALSDGTSTFSSLARLSGKESSRAEEMIKTLEAFDVGVNVTKYKNGVPDEIIITGRTVSSPGRISAGNDHRIAMAITSLALAAEDGTVIEDAECVSKSFPGFFESLGITTAE